MKDRDLTEERSRRQSSNKPLLIRDIVKYLSGLAKLNEDPHIGNPELSLGLKELAITLRPYSRRQLEDIADILGLNLPSNDAKSRSTESKNSLPSDLESLNANLVEEIIFNEDFQKSQLIELGVKRFGISKSKLDRLNRDAVVESIRSALNHEKSIGVISQEAKRSGEKRSS